MRKIAAILLPLLLAPQVQAESPKLLVWINGDKAYNGLHKVGRSH